VDNKCVDFYKLLEVASITMVEKNVHRRREVRK
jgi:hypothetical protein